MQPPADDPNPLPSKAEAVLDEEWLAEGEDQGEEEEPVLTAKELQLLRLCIPQPHVPSASSQSSELSFWERQARPPPSASGSSCRKP